MNTVTKSGATGAGINLQVCAVIDTAVAITRAIAQPSFVQFLLRIALAVPFWRSGILKWSGFLQLNDTAVLLFSDEFKLHQQHTANILPSHSRAARSVCRLRVPIRHN
jgi:putative oxidoreductase